MPCTAAAAWAASVSTSAHCSRRCLSRLSWRCTHGCEGGAAGRLRSLGVAFYAGRAAAPAYPGARSTQLPHDLLHLQAVTAATDSFRTLLETHKWPASSASSLSARSRQPSGLDASAAAAAGEGGGEAAAAAGGGGLPQGLVDHVPLAVYANGLLSAFNELRHCAPLSLRQTTAGELQGSLVAVSAALAHYGLTRSLSDSEQAAFDACCKAHTGTLTPYIAACFERIYAGGAALVDAAAVVQPIADMAAQQQEGS